MRGPDDDQQIDFVIGPDSIDLGEDLLVEPAPNRRLRTGLIALGVAVLVGSIVARVGASSDGLPTAQPSPSQSSSSEAAFPDVISPTAGVVPHSTTYAKTCPLDDRSRSLCTNANPLPADVLAALRAHFPGAHVHSSREEELRDLGYGYGGPGMLYYRELRARVGPVLIYITVHPIIDSDHASIKLSPTSITVQSLSPADTARVQITSSHKRLPSLHTVYALASDRRLVVDGQR